LQGRNKKPSRHKYCKIGKEFFVRSVKENKKWKANRHGKRKRKWIMNSMHEE
jgi:hypothetical protein